MTSLLSEPETVVPSVIEGTGLSATFGRDEARKIHEENMNKLTAMSEEEILAEQRKLLQTLGKVLITHTSTGKCLNIDLHLIANMNYCFFFTYCFTSLSTANILT